MLLDEYQDEARRTAPRTDDAYPLGVREGYHALNNRAHEKDLLKTFDVMTWGLGLTGEAGEVADLLKKGYGHGHGVDVEKLTKELGDCLWYLSNLADAFGVTLSTVARENVAKLRARYPSGFSVEASKAKADERPAPERLSEVLDQITETLADAPKRTAEADRDAVEGAKLWSAEDARVGICAAASPDGYLCTRSPNHDGTHIAANSVSHVLDRWANLHQIAKWSDPQVAYQRVFNKSLGDVIPLPIHPKSVSTCTARPESPFQTCPKTNLCREHACSKTLCFCPEVP